MRMRNNHVREKLRRGEPSIGAFLGLESPNVAELFGHHGFEWLLIETEHNGLDAAEVETMVRAIETTEAIPLVRVPSRTQADIQRRLDEGFLMINYGADYALLAALAREGVETFRDVTSSD